VGVNRDNDAARGPRALWWLVGLVMLAACDVDDSDDGRTSMATTESVGSTGAAETSETTDPRGDDSTGQLTGGPAPEHACEAVSECRLHSDCCTCEALHVDQLPETCDAQCERTMCQQWGITQLLCSHTCLIKLVDCDATMVTCAESAPACDDGFAPGVDERCWSGHCVPEHLCRPA
jgi:hypothetical protein